VALRGKEDNTLKKRILFVDDEPNVLQGLRRMLWAMRHEWDMTFVESGQQALELLTHAPFDVVVSDMCMPGMDGAQLLTEVMERYPHIVRIVLSGHSDHAMVLRSVGTAHQYLAKPCESGMLKATVAHVCGLRDVMANERLQRLVSGMKTLPSLPTLYHEVLEVMDAPDGSLDKVGKIIARDMGMTAKILQLVNSAFFGLRQHVSSPTQAVKRLGLDMVRCLILSVGIFSHFDQAQLRALSLEALWQHSLATGVCARSLAEMENCDRKMVETAAMAGLLHDVGKLIFAANLPEQYGEALALVQAQKMTMYDAEWATLEATHAEAGAYLLGLWGLPDAIIEALALHHCPQVSPERSFGLLTVVHVANALAHAGAATETAVPVDHEYLAALGLSHRLADWQAHCRTVLAEKSQV
jgi:putative nucleotidyltransferase with HDIG domain